MVPSPSLRRCGPGTGDIYDTLACRNTRSRGCGRSKHLVSAQDHILYMLKTLEYYCNIVKKVVKIAQITTSMESPRIRAIDRFIVDINNAYTWVARLERSRCHRRWWKVGCIYLIRYQHLLGRRSSRKDICR